MIDALAAIELRRKGSGRSRRRSRRETRWGPPWTRARRTLEARMKRHQVELPLGSGIDRGMTVISYGH